VHCNGKDILPYKVFLCYDQISLIRIYQPSLSGCLQSEWTRVEFSKKRGFDGRKALPPTIIN
jgi:hypothetical protein